MRMKGDLEIFTGKDLGHSGVPYRFEVRHEGPGVVRQWSRLALAQRLEAAREKIKLIDELGGDEAARRVFAAEFRGAERARLESIERMRSEGQDIPLSLSEPTDVMDVVSTPAVVESIDRLQRAVVGSVLTRVYDHLDVWEGPAAVQEAERLGVLGALFLKVQEVQRLTPAHFPAAPDPGHGDGAAP